MKKQYLVLLFALFALMLVFSGCNSDDKDKITDIPDFPDITPDKYDWSISLLDFEDEDRGPDNRVNYDLVCDWLGADNPHQSGDTYSIQFGNEEPLELYVISWGSYFKLSAEAELEAGKEYSVKLMRNGSSITSGNIKTPYRALVHFPHDYDATQATEITWEMAGNNRGQFLTVDYNGLDDEDKDSDYFVNLAPSARKHRIPANAVPAAEGESYHEISLLQFNYNISGRTFFEALQSSSKSYEEWHYPTKWAMEKRRAITQKIMEMDV